jgi:hypothetical protein
VGVLPVQVADGPAGLQGLPSVSPSQFQGSFTLAFTGGIVHSKDIGTVSANVNFNPSGDAHINLGLVLDSSAINQDFPSIGGNLVVDWPLTAGAVNATALPSGDGSGQPGTKPAVSLNDIEVTNLNAFFTSFLDPIYQPLNEYLSPIKPILNFLDSPLPVLSDAFGITVTPLDFLTGLGVSPDTIDFIKAADNIISRNLPTDAGLQGNLDFGSFSLPGSADPRTTSLQALAGQFTASQAMSPAMQNLAREVSNDLVSMLPGKPSVPLLDPSAGPGIVLGTLLGQKETLFTYTTPTFNLQTDVPITPLTEPGIAILPPFPVFLKATPHIGVEASLSVGYDTQGLMEAHPNPLDGFYFFNPAGGAASGIALTGGVKVDVTGNLGLIEVGGGGDLNVTLGLQLDTNRTVSGKSYFDVLADGTHAVRFNDMADMISAHGPLALFDIGGGVDVSLNYYYRVGFPPLGFEIDQDFGDVTLFNFNFDPWSSPPSLPGLADYVDPLNKFIVKASHQVPNANNADIIAPDNPGDTTLRLNLGDFPGSRKVGLGEPQEDYEITPVVDPATGKNKPNAIDITAFGATQEYDNVTKIEAFGNSNNAVNITSEDIAIETGVTADAELHGGGFAPMVGSGGTIIGPIFQKNIFRYLGTGTASLYGGMFATNDLYGGAGTNNLFGSDLGALEANDPTKASNHLFGGKGINNLNGGQADAVLTAGPRGSSNTLNAGPGYTDPKTNTFYPADYYLVAGQGSTMMNGNAAMNYYQWQEGDGPLTVVGANPKGLFHTNDLSISGGSGGSETWTVSSPSPGGLQVHGQKPSGNIVNILASVLSDLNIDNPAGDVNQNSNPGNNTYIIDDLSGTGIQNINVNLHTALRADQSSDQTFVFGSEPFDQASVSVNGPFSSVRMQNSGRNHGGRFKDYTVQTSIPGPADVLTVHTLGGNAQVGVSSTQAQGTTNIFTDAGTNQVYVGNTLDNILGQLNIDEGTGSNALHFDNSNSFIANDTVTLNSSQLIRYMKETVTIPPLNGVVFPPETASPMIINYKASGGNFGNGLALDTSSGGTNLFIPSLPASAPTSVTVHGFTGDPSDAITIGYDGANPNGPANAASLGTLAGLASPLSITGMLGQHSDVVVDDLGSTKPDGYTLSNGMLFSTLALPISYANLAKLTVDAPATQANNIVINHTSPGTQTTVNAGNGKNTFIVADPQGRIDGILGPLTINGGAGSADLTIHDDGNSIPMNYQLDVGTLVRQSTPAININYARLTSLTFFAGHNATGVNSIAALGTPAGVPVTVHSDGAAVNYTAGNLTAGSLDRIQGPLSLKGSGGTRTLLVNDQAVKTSQTYTLAAGAIARTGMAGITFDPLQSLALQTGLTMPDTVAVLETPGGTNVSLVLGKVNNTVTVGEPVPADPQRRLSLDSIKGPLKIAGGGASQLTLDDRGAAIPRTYRLSADTFQFGSPGPSIQLNSVTSEVVDGANQPNTFVVNGTAVGTNVTLNTGTAANDAVDVVAGPLNPIQGGLTVNAQGGGASLTFDDSTNTNPGTYSVTANMITRTGLATVTYQNLAQLTLKGGSTGISRRDNYVVTGTASGTTTNITAGTGTNIYRCRLRPRAGAWRWPAPLGTTNSALWPPQETWPTCPTRAMPAMAPSRPSSPAAAPASMSSIRT